MKEGGRQRRREGGKAGKGNKEGFIMAQGSKRTRSIVAGECSRRSMRQWSHCIHSQKVRAKKSHEPCLSR